MEDDATSEETKKERSGLFGDRTSTGRSQSRSDRKEKRLEDRFDKQGDDKFLVKAYLKAVELLKDQVLATRIDIFNTIKNKLAGSKYGDPILRSADTLLALMINLKLNAEKLAKEEGSRLEPIKNAEDIKTYKSLYAENEKEYEELKKKWNDAKLKEQNEQPVLAANQKIEKSLNTAKKYFSEAQTEFGSNFTQFVQKKGEEKKEEVKKADSSTTTGSTTTLKQRSDAYTGTDGDIVKEVKKLIYNKFGKYATLKNSSDWKAVYKNWPTVTGSLRTNTANVIKAVKKGSATDYPDLASDKTGDITPKFLEILRGIKEGLSYNTSKIVSFESFMKNRISEAFDEEAAGTVLSKASTKKSKSSSSSSSGKSNVPEDPATPFKTKEEGNKFREWVNKKYPDWAKENNLDASGSENNSYIRKAYSEYGSNYAESNVAPVVVKKEVKLTGTEMNSIKNMIKSYAGYTEMQLTTNTGEPVIYYRGDSKSQSKGYGHYYNNRRLSYKTSAGKVFWGTHSPKNKNVKFDNGKTFNEKDVFKMTISNSLSGEKDSVAQSKKAYISKSGDGYVNVRSSAAANTGTVNNLIYKHTDKNSPIGMVISSTVAKSSKIGDKTWYKIQFPSKRGRYESGFVRADTVDLK
jgi:hypothetical protein